MALVEKSVLLPYSAEQMFALVDNVADYPLFLPWCGGASVEAVGESTIHATVHINYHQIKQSFTTENVRHAPSDIKITLQDGPFRHLDGNWHFTALSPTACKIEFRLHYEFSSKLLEKMVGPVFHYVANSFVDAFTHRAEKVYATNERQQNQD
ncbi:MAG: type II toxin-antitoxin system RatA family toxin [Gallionellaceae bacterium]|nr:MAG: type II toxin-antitoxin system RatA family toxin [Gallionellaceae bacterium]